MCTKTLRHFRRTMHSRPNTISSNNPLLASRCMWSKHEVKRMVGKGRGGARLPDISHSSSSVQPPFAANAGSAPAALWFVRRQTLEDLSQSDPSKLHRDTHASRSRFAFQPYTTRYTYFSLCVSSSLFYGLVGGGRLRAPMSPLHSFRID